MRSVVENLDGSPESIIMESVLEGMAEYYSRNLGRETMKGMRENALKSRHTGGKPPLGYDVNKETKKLIINDYEAGAVKLIFKMVLDGRSYGNIIEQLHLHGYKTKRGEAFGKNSIHCILTNEKYTGVYIFSKRKGKNVDGKYNAHSFKDESEIIRIEGGVPQIISREDFEAIQEIMKKRKQQAGKMKAKRPYLLSGKVYCGECGSKFSGHTRSPSKKTQTISPPTFAQSLTKRGVARIVKCAGNP